MSMHTLNWHEPRTTQQLTDLEVGDEVRLERLIEPSPGAGVTFRVTQVPTARRMWELHLQEAPFGRPQWTDGWVMFGELVPEYGPLFDSTEQLPCPVAVAYKFADSASGGGAMWIGAPGQDVGMFRQDVLRAVPRQLTVQERLASLGNKAVVVTLACEAGSKRDTLVAAIANGAPTDQILVHLAETGVSACMASSQSDVMIIADRIRWSVASAPESVCDMLGELIRSRRCIGWPISELPGPGGSKNPVRLEFVSGILIGLGCTAIYSDPTQQDIVGLILDAAQVTDRSYE